MHLLFLRLFGSKQNLPCIPLREAAAGGIPHKNLQLVFWFKAHKPCFMEQIERGHGSSGTMAEKHGSFFFCGTFEMFSAYFNHEKTITCSRFHVKPLCEVKDMLVCMLF